MKHSRSRLAVVLIVVGIGGAALATSSQAARHLRQEGHAAQSLAGSWLVEVTIHNPPPGVPPKVLALRTYTADGGVIESGSSRLASGGHGAWARTGNRQFRAAWTFFRFVDGGALLGIQHVAATTTLRPGGDRFEGTGNFVLLAPNGQELFRGTATDSGVRLGVD